MAKFQKKQATLEKEAQTETPEVVNSPNEVKLENKEETLKPQKSYDIWDNGEKYREQGTDNAEVEVKTVEKPKDLDEQMADAEAEAKAIVAKGLKMAEDGLKEPETEDDEINPDGDDNSSDEPEKDTTEAEDPQTGDKTPVAELKDNGELPDIPAVMIAEAVRKGMTVPDAMAVRSPERLREVLDLLPDLQSNKTATKEEQEEKIISDEEREQFDDDTLSVLDKFENKIKELQGKLIHSESKNAEVEEATKRQAFEAQRQSHLEAFDKEISALPKDLFGEGDFTSVKQGTKEYDNRDKLWKEMAREANAYVSSGEPVPPMKTLVERAMKLAFSEELQKMKMKDLTTKVDERSKNITLKPSSSRTESIINKPEDEKYAGAYNAVRSLITKFGKK